jgi:hypothetical protein
MSFFSNLITWIPGGRPTTHTAQSPSLNTHLNLNHAEFTPRPFCEGASLLSSIEKTTALVNLLKRSTQVSLDRSAGTITVEHEGGTTHGELLQLATEVYAKTSGSSKLFLMPRSPMRRSMAEHHVGAVESILRQAAQAGKAPPTAGLVITSQPTKPYSRLGAKPFTRLPETIQHGEYQFFAPGPERATMMLFLSGLCGPEHVLLPSIVLHNQSPSSNDNISVSPAWHVARLAEVVNAELAKREPLESFYDLVYHWRDFLSFSEFDLPLTLSGLAHSLGLEINQRELGFPGGPVPFVISGNNPAKELMVHLQPPDSSNHQMLSIGWAHHVG